MKDQHKSHQHRRLYLLKVNPLIVVNEYHFFRSRQTTHNDDVPRSIPIPASGASCSNGASCWSDSVNASGSSGNVSRIGGVSRSRSFVTSSDFAAGSSIDGMLRQRQLPRSCGPRTRCRPVGRTRSRVSERIVARHEGPRPSLLSHRLVCVSCSLTALSAGRGEWRVRGGGRRNPPGRGAARCAPGACASAGADPPVCKPGGMGNAVPVDCYDTDT
jgi:hypothetical protein